MVEKKYQEMPFGFESQEIFATAVSAYIQSIKEDIGDGDMSWADGLEERKKQRYLEMVQNRREEIALLEERSQDIPALFSQVKGFYDEMIALEQAGADRGKIAEEFVANHDAEVIALGHLMEHGLKVTWGYHFVQSFLAVRAHQQWERDKSKKQE